MNAQGDQLDCTVSGGKTGVQRDCVVCVCVFEGCGMTWRWDHSFTCYILNFLFDVLYSILCLRDV